MRIHGKKGWGGGTASRSSPDPAAAPEGFPQPRRLRGLQAPPTHAGSLVMVRPGVPRDSPALSTPRAPAVPRHAGSADRHSRIVPGHAGSARLGAPRCSRLCSRGTVLPRSSSLSALPFQSPAGVGGARSGAARGCRTLEELEGTYGHRCAQPPPPRLQPLRGLLGVISELGTGQGSRRESLMSPPVPLCHFAMCSQLPPSVSSPSEPGAELGGGGTGIAPAVSGGDKKGHGHVRESPVSPRLED